MKRKHEVNLAGVTWLETLAKLSNGALLAIILYKLEKRDLCSIRCASKTIQHVCDRYQMMERLYTDSVYMFGNGIHGKLGRDILMVSIPTRILNTRKVASVSCSESHTGIVTVDGDVYMFGSGLSGRLGNGHTNEHYVAVPKKIQGIPKVTTISCGFYHTGIVTVDGDVYMFGNGFFGKLGDGDIDDHNVEIPKQIQGIPKVTTLSCGTYHTGIITVDGDVYMFGRGNCGQLGDGDYSEHEVGIPMRISAPKAATISCGTYHTGIVTVDGDVYMFGDGSYGRLGDGVTSNHYVGVPRQIENIPKIAGISCGAYHTGIRTTNGDVYMFGSTTYGKLGDGNTRNHNVGIPKQIQGIPRVTAIFCGSCNTGIVTVDGEVYMFGDGSYGRLGDGDFSDHNVGIPRRICRIPKVASISCGTTHTGIVTVAESTLNLSILR